MRPHVRGINKEENTRRGPSRYISVQSPKAQAVIHHSRHALSPPVASSHLVSPPSQPITAYSLPQLPPVGHSRPWHAPCLAGCYTPISWSSRAESTNPKTGHIWPKGAFCPLFHLCCALAWHAITVDDVCLVLAFFISAILQSWWK